MNFQTFEYRPSVKSIIMEDGVNEQDSSNAGESAVWLERQDSNPKTLGSIPW